MKAKTTTFSIVIFLICTIAIFYHLDKKPLNMWDESRSAISAYEMYKNGFSIVTTYHEEPDMWSTKPPLLIWLQGISFHLFGVNLFAFRLPSAVSGLAVVLMISLWLKKRINDTTSWILAPLILISIPGFLEYHHSIKTGDFDALLGFWVLSYVVVFDIFLEEYKKHYLLYFFVFLSLAVLTKSIAGLIILPALVLSTIIRRRLKLVFLNKHFYWGLLIFTVLIGGFYGCREYLNPGYLEAVWNNELGGRYSKTLEGHEKPWSFFFAQLFDKKYGLWGTLFFLSPLFIFSWGNSSQKKLGGYLLGIVLFELIIISLSKTKLSWYDFQVLPFIAILNALAISTIISRLTPYISGKRLKLIAACGMAFYLILPYGNILRKYSEVKMDQKYQKDYKLNYVLHDIYKSGVKDEQLCSVAYFDYCPNLQFYLLALKHRNNDIGFFEEERPYMRKCIYVEQRKDLEYLMSSIDYSTIDTTQSIYVLR